MKRVTFVKYICLAVLAILFGITARFPSFAQPPSNASEDPDIIQLQPNFYVIARLGANISVQTGADGVVLVDSGRTDASDRALAAIRKLTSQPIRFIINTSADLDHIGGNERLGNAGQALRAGGGIFNISAGSGATLLAHENVLSRLGAPTGTRVSVPSALWPSETFFQKEKSFYLNHEPIVVSHEPFAHSDGDVTVFFRRSDVVAVGDLIDTNRFPVIDVESGGSIQGEIDALNRLVALAVPSTPLVWQPGGTYVVPGHGRIYDQPDVVEYRDMITIIRDVVENMMKKGMTLDEVKKAKPAKGYASVFGAESGAWTTDKFVEAIYKSLKKQ